MAPCVPSVAAGLVIGADERVRDPRLIMAGEYRMAHTYLLQCRGAAADHAGPTPGRRIGQPPDGTEDADMLSLTAACALLVAVLEAREGKAEAAERNLEVARQLAAPVSSGRNEYVAEFAPANVAVNAASVAVELGNAKDAIRRAESGNTDGPSPGRGQLPTRPSHGAPRASRRDPSGPSASVRAVRS